MGGYLHGVFIRAQMGRMQMHEVQQVPRCGASMGWVQVFKVRQNPQQGASMGWVQMYDM